MTDYSFLKFIKPECINKDKLEQYVKFDSQITMFDIDNWLRMEIIDFEEYKQFLKTLLERQEREVWSIKRTIEMAEKQGEDLKPWLSYSLINPVSFDRDCCCSAERPEIKSDLEKEIEEKMNGSTNE